MAVNAIYGYISSNYIKVILIMENFDPQFGYRGGKMYFLQHPQLRPLPAVDVYRSSVASCPRHIAGSTQPSQRHADTVDQHHYGR